MYSTQLDLDLYEKQISGLICTNSLETEEELIKKTENIKRFDFAFQSLFKPQIIINFFICVSLTYNTLSKCNDLVADYEKNTENNKHYLKTYLSIKD